MATERYTIEINLEGRDHLSDDLRNVNQRLDQLGQKGRAAGSGAGQAAGGLQSIATFAGALGAAWVANSVGQKLQELVDVGTQANQVEEVFTQLAGGPDAALEAMERLRDETGGVVDDLSLQLGSNSLLITGLAQTNEEAAELVGLAVDLGAAMGQDATSSIENFNAALLNNSFQRLDTLGISAAAVRERVAELKEEGLDMSEAFAQATLEQGRLALEKLGDAANVSETEIAKLRTTFQNFTQDVGQELATRAEAAAGAVNAGLVVADLLINGNEFDRQIDALREQATDEFARRDDLINLGDLVLGLQANPAAAQALGGGQDIRNFFSGETTVPESQLLQLGSQVTGRDATILNERDRILFLNELAAKLELVTAAETDRAAAQEDSIRLARLASEQEATAVAAAQEEARLIEQQLRQARFASEEFQAIGDQFDDFFQLQSEFESGTVTFESGTFFDPRNLDEVLTRADEMEQRFEDVKAIAEETDFQYITEDELAQMGQFAEEARSVADEAERGAEAFSNLSLAQLAGQTSGGQLAELLDKVLARADEDQRAQFQDVFDLASGRATELSQAIDDNVAPALLSIAETLGPELATEASQAVIDGINQGRLAGFSDTRIAENLQQIIDEAVAANTQFSLEQVQGTGGVVDFGGIQGFERPTGLTDAAALGGEEEGSPLERDAEATEQIATNLDLVNGLTYESVGGLTESLTLADDKAAQIETKLTGLAQTEFRARIPLEITLDDLTGIGLASNPAFASAVQIVFANNGQRLPELNVGAGPQ